MRKEFEQFLFNEGYKEYTPNGHPSTVYDYIKRIDAVCAWENTDWLTLARNIGSVLPEYEEGGVKEHLGRKSHNAVRSALRCFAKFNKEQKMVDKQNRQ